MFSFALLQRKGAWLFAATLAAGLGAGGWYFDSVDVPAAADATAAPQLPAHMARDVAPFKVRHLAHWAVHSGDSAGLPFLILDKGGARLFTFDPAGRLRASAPVLLGAAVGDGPDVPATPAGRFVTDAALQAGSEGLVWTSASGQLVLHEPQSQLLPGRAAERLASASAADHRISDGSLHVPPEFFRTHLGGLRQRSSVAYVLPEQRPLQQVLGASIGATHSGEAL